MITLSRQDRVFWVSRQPERLEQDAIPHFMPVGTAVTVKAVFPQDVGTTVADVLLGNVYHLMLRPGGADRAAGRFAAVAGPIRACAIIMWGYLWGRYAFLNIII